jgi:gamma-glutamyltranspeptidase/glutathione hydrolase
MNLAFADRDFYYGDPYFPPEEPIEGLLSEDYAKQRAAAISPGAANDPAIGPGDPYPFQGSTNPHAELLKKRVAASPPAFDPARFAAATDPVTGSFYRGTTSVVAVDKEGWLVSMTPSGAWLPAVIAGRTGIGMSQRAQQFVIDPAVNPYNVIEPGKRPRVTLTPSLAFKDGKPWLAFAVQGGDTQDQNLLQFFLNVVEFGMTPQQAAEAPNITSYQMRDSFVPHESFPGRITLNDAVPDWVRRDLKARGYQAEFSSRTSGPINAILIDHAHGTFWGGSSHHGEDYGIAW